MASRKPTIVTAGFSSEISKALEPVKQSVEMITGARAGFTELRGLPLNTSAEALMGKINEIIERINASGTYTCQRATADAPLSDAGVQPEDLTFLPITGGTLTGAVTGTTFTANRFYGPLTGAVTGNADTATNATNDSDGNAIKSTYLKKSGGTLTGSLSGTSATFSGALVGQTVRASSDKRLKKHIRNYDADLSGLHAKSYEFKKGDGTTQIGLIAQDVEWRMPEAVKADEKGNLSLDYNAVVAVLVNKVNELERRLACLTNTR